MAEELTPDLCVIGAGSGGLSVAAGAAMLGVPMVLIEKGRMGGECLNSGCVPSKALIAAARRAHALRVSRAFGIGGWPAEVDYDAVSHHVHHVIASVAPNDSKERLRGLGVRVIEGAAQFKDGATVIVGDDYSIRARRFVIATGSMPVVPPIEGLDRTPYLTNETVFELRDRPRHLIVIGAGATGLELAQTFRRLGAEVTVLEAAEPLAKEDPECAAVVLDTLIRDGVTIRSRVNVARVDHLDGRIAVTLAGTPAETVTGSHLLIAAGRRANIEGLALEQARIEHNGDGIVVDRRLRTTNRKVYAVGDVAGPLRFTHVANHHAGLVLRHALFRLPVKIDPDVLPRVTFTDPELAHVGLDERQARERHRSIRVLRWPYRENDRAQAERETAGHIKVVTTRRGKVLGATIVGAAAGELISTWTLAVAQGLNIRVFAGIVVPYPTLAEIGRRAALGFFTPRLTSPGVRRLLGLLRRLG